MKNLTVLALCLAVGAANAQIFANQNFDVMPLGSQLRNQLPFNSFGDTGFAVSSAQALSGGQSIAVTGTTSGWNWVDISPEYDPSASANKILVSSIDFFMSSNNLNTRIGLDAYQNLPVFSRVAAVRANASNNFIELFANSNAVGATSTVTFARDTWNNLRLTMDYNSNTARAALNGVDLGISVTIAGNPVADVDIWRANQVGSTGTTFVDNYRVQAVPEPATMTALVLGVAALLRRRKKA